MNSTSGGGGVEFDSPIMNGMRQADAVHAARKAVGDGDGPAAAGDPAPERAEATEQVVLLLHTPNAGFLSRLWRCGESLDGKLASHARNY